MTVTFAQPLSATGLDGHAGRIADDMTALIRHADATWPRRTQTEIGPSELGHPCLRRLAYRLLDHPESNPHQDPLPAIVGTGTHMWLDDAVARCGGGRYLSNLPVVISGGIKGHLDLLDTLTRTVIDLKVPGPTGMKKYRAGHPGEAYRAQVHLYGLGLHNAGYTPEYVADLFLPRCGRLDGLYVWSEPWSQQVAEDALNRHATLAALLGMLNADENPGPALEQIAMTPTHCGFCPWSKAGSTDLAEGCPGDLKAA